MRERVRPLNIAVVGVEHRRGRAFLKVLEKTSLPVGFLRPLVAGSVGNRLLSFRNADYAIDLASPLSFKGCDLVFFLAAPEVTLALCEAAVRAGCICIDGSGAYSLSSLYRFFVPAIHGEVVTAEERVFVSPEPAAVCLAHILYPLHQRAGIEQGIITYLQGVLGEEEEKELKYRYKEYLEGSPYPEPPFSFQLVFNLVPVLGEERVKGETLVEKQIQFQLKKIFAFPGMDVKVTALKVPVLGASAFQIYLKVKKGLMREEVEAIFQHIPDLRLCADHSAGKWPTPRSAATAHVYELGRIRAYPEEGELQFFMAVDEMERGFAKNVTAIAEYFASSVQAEAIGGRS